MMKRPVTVDLASWLLWTLVAAGLVMSVAVVVFRGDLDRVWSPMEAGDTTVQPTEFVPVVLVLYGVIAVTMLTMIQLFRHRHLWAQHGLACFALGILVGTLAVMRTDSPFLVLVGAGAAGVVAAVAVVFVWHPETSRFIRSAEGS
ncbi:hypothetical protein E8D34_02980 [Nocardioides sp. GY 10113]|uniref:hypothetical protein n=1 Tax=Nocardioides sp. GY 10113 TaxID=2569761 RepID=UPI0010A8CF52|nr:hypothetical protein [Nocardioides sp. GY 10113]TIC88654.1 hypothetical protein E8D34_02980 [Nocardioides sp. GY 10113]